MVRKEEGERRGPTGWDGAAGEIHRRNFSDLLSSHLLHWREERGKEGELHYFFVVPSYVKFVGSFIHTGSSGLYIHLHTTSLPLFLFRHSLRRRGRCEIFPKFFVGAASLILVGHGVLTSLVSLPSKSNLPNPALKARNASSFPSRPSRQSSSRAFKVPSPQPRFINRSCRHTASSRTQPGNISLYMKSFGKLAVLPAPLTRGNSARGSQNMC